MLVLARLPGESITITAPDGTRLRVTYVRRSGSGTHLGIEAPPEYRIVRDELLDKTDETAIGLE